MAKKEFNESYPKSIALTLRMLKPYFSSGRVLIADLWFGSVACALALFRHGLFAVMNVKTATKNYPKAELMAEVDEIKGNSEERRAARRARRGEQVAFTCEFQVGSRKVTLTAVVVTTRRCRCYSSAPPSRCSQATSTSRLGR